MSQRSKSLARRLAATAAVATVLAALGAGAAQAGQWMRAICQNPNGSAAGISGFSFSAQNSGYVGETDCQANSQTGLGASVFVPSNGAGGSGSPLSGPVSATWTYTAPSGSTITGGRADVAMAQIMDIGASGTYTHSDVWVSTPGNDTYPGDLVAGCGSPLQDLSNNACALTLSGLQNPPPLPVATGVVPITNTGGSQLFVSAECGTGITDACWSFYGGGAVLSAGLRWADLLLTDTSAPTGSGFGGSLLAPGSVHGTAQLTFTAADPAGPGVYQVIVKIDGKTAYQATPNTNAGACVPAGTDSTSGALIFDSQQPCPASENVDVPVNTTQLSDAEHDVQVIVQDAAQNSSTVLDQAISTTNLTTVASTTSEGPAPTPAGGAGAVVYALRLDPRSQKLAGAILHRRYDSSRVKLSGTVLNAAGAPAPNVAVSVRSGSTTATGFVTLASTTTDGTGHFVLTVPRGDDRTLQLIAGTATVSFKQLVSPNVSLRVRALPGARLLFTGAVAINWAGSPRPTVEIKDRTPTGPQVIATVTVNKHGRYRYSYQASRLVIGYSFSIRAVTRPTAFWQGSASRLHKTTVRG